MKKIYYIFSFTLLFIVGCDKENNNPNSPPKPTPITLKVIEGGEIARFEVVNLEFENLTQEKYKGSINGKEINLVRSKENILSFVTDQTVALGEQFLKIPELKSKVKYNIKETVLEKTVEKTLEDLSNIFNGYVKVLKNTKQDAYVKNVVQQYNTAVSKLSEADKKIIASVYQANKEFFDSLYQKDYTVLQQRTADDYSHLSFGALTIRWAAATYGAGSATWLAVASASTPLMALTLAVAAVTLWSISYDLWKEGVSRTKVIYNRIEWDNFFSNLFNRKLSTYNKTANNYIEFISNEEKAIAFRLQARGITAKDKNSKSTVVKSFFTTIDNFNKVVNNLNGVITKVNSIPLINMSLIDKISVGTSKGETIAATKKVFDNLKISVDHENLKLSKVKFSNGNIYMTITIKNDTKINKFIKSTINYSYKDETNEFKSSFPIKVTKEGVIDLSGTWVMRSDNADIKDTATFQFNKQGITFLGKYSVFNRDIVKNTYSLKNDELSILHVRHYFHDVCSDSDVKVKATINIKATYNKITKKFKGYYSDKIIGGISKDSTCRVHGSSQKIPIILYKKK